MKKCYIIIFSLIIQLAYAESFENLKDKVIRKYIPEFSKKDTLCQKGSLAKEGYLEKVILSGKEFFIINNHRIVCVGAYSLFSGSGGAEFTVIDKSLKKHFDFYAFEKSKNIPNDHFIFGDRTKKCPSQVIVRRLIFKSDKFSFEDVRCIPKNSPTKENS